MKKPLILCLLAIVSMACQDDTKKLLNTIDGRWQVNTVTYTNQAGRDSVITLKTDILNFISCSKKSNNGGPSNCNVEYIADNKPFDFVYQAGSRDDKKSIFINQKGSPITDAVHKQIAERIVGSYSIITLTDNALVLRRELGGSMPGYQFIQYSATK